ncbi:putative disease resistance protein RGA3 [Ziziphus jujuba]|uniref:Disease resistance protein RGA3 n=1 Tax=Ziziphus jujuba TaxID=326968 RepID=A0ABM3IJG8_ZIZJJ|nr:putative disease resistance protein RGA3 [Ziziphus jujuba]
MAEIVLSGVVDRIIHGLGSAAVHEIALLWGVNDELSGLQETISTIKAVLLDAEKKQFHNNEVRAWLKRLENAFYDADDLEDEFNTEAALPKQRMLGSTEMTKLGCRIKAIKDRLEAIRKDRKFHLDETCKETKVETTKGRETHSEKPEKEATRRDKDKMAIVERLLDPKIEENIFVVPIVGCGGLGKTTLAKLLFNDDKIKQLQKGPLLYKDIESLEMDQLQKRLQKEIVGKKYLLVLDDVWNENRELWLELKGLLAKCAKGSRIILTTRSIVVAEITSTMKPYILERLDKEESWSLFKNVAFRHDQMSNDSKISEIGREIVDKCGGIPLAIRKIGRMLYNKNPNTEWSSFRRKEFSTIDQEKK